jgi:hypothetical protein
MENCPFIDDVPIKTSIYTGIFHGYVSHNQMVNASQQGKSTNIRTELASGETWRNPCHQCKTTLESLQAPAT